MAELSFSDLGLLGPSFFCFIIFFTNMAIVRSVFDEIPVRLRKMFVGTNIFKELQVFLL